METQARTVQEFFDLSKIGPFSDDEVSMMLEAIFKKINVSFAKNEEVPKTILVDLFGTQKSMKTSVTGKVEQVFRRHGFKVFCPPETAEHEGIRSLDTDNPVVEQAKHLNGVRAQALYMARHPRVHFGMTSRGLIDMLYWYKKGLKKGTYSPAHVESIKNEVVELLQLQLVDAFFFFTCSVETVMRREYDGSLTQRRGSKMNEKDVADTIGLYNEVLAEIEESVPGLPIFHIDTSEMDLRQAGQEVLRYLLPTICRRFGIPDYSYMPYLPTLVQRRARHSDYFEEQLKLSGHPDLDRLFKAGWVYVKETHEEDTYFNPDKNKGEVVPSGETMRLRCDYDGTKFMYKGEREDMMFSHCRPVTFKVNAEEIKKIQETYPAIAYIFKERKHYRKQGSTGDGHFFSLHLDRVRGLGLFTEIRARGSDGATHAEEMLKLAGELGFTLSDVLEGNYLSMVFKK